MRWCVALLALLLLAPIAAAQSGPPHQVWGYVVAPDGEGFAVKLTADSYQATTSAGPNGYFQFELPSVVADGTQAKLRVDESEWSGGNTLTISRAQAAQRVDIHGSADGAPYAKSDAPHQVWGYAVKADGTTPQPHTKLQATWPAGQLEITSEGDGYYQIDLGGAARPWSPGQQLTLTGATTYWDASASVQFGSGGPQRLDVVFGISTDDDKDGIRNEADNCPASANVGQADVDEDNKGDACDDNPTDGPAGDEDGDGVLNKNDNCRASANPSQLDADGDGRGDVCDPDRDGDQVRNDVEVKRGTDPDDPASYPAPPGYQKPTTTEKDGGVEIAWEPVDGAAGYSVWRSASPYAKIGETPGDRLYLDTSVQAGHPYAYRIVAFDSDDVGRGNLAAFLTGFETAPSQSITPTATPQPASGGAAPEPSESGEPSDPDGSAPSDGDLTAPDTQAPVQGCASKPCPEPLSDRPVNTPGPAIGLVVAAMAALVYARRKQ